MDVLSEMAWPLPARNLPSDQCASIYQFVISLITNQNNLTTLQQIADYNISHNTALPLINQHEASFIILPNRLDNGSVCYVIDTNSQYSTDQWLILLTDPTTVIQCIHMHFNGSLKNMAHYLYYSSDEPPLSPPPIYAILQHSIHLHLMST